MQDSFIPVELLQFETLEGKSLESPNQTHSYFISVLVYDHNRRGEPVHGVSGRESLSGREREASPAIPPVRKYWGGRKALPLLPLPRNLSKRAQVHIKGTTMGLNG